MARDEETWWKSEIGHLAGKLLVAGPVGLEIRAGELAALPKAVGRRLVRFAIENIKGDLRRLEFAHVESVLALASRAGGSGRIELPGATVVRSFDWVLFRTGRESPASSIQVNAPGCIPWPAARTNIVLEVTERKGSSSPNRDPDPYATLEVELCWNRVRGPLELRGWRSGDAYWPQGRTRKYKVRELFQDYRVPSWRRSGWPILLGRSASGQNEIVWAKGFGAAQELVEDADAGPVLRIWEKQESFVGGSASY
jgi:tRNA(Ile)-lysidine synthase